jgi:hypothetical protein
VKGHKYPEQGDNSEGGTMSTESKILELAEAMAISLPEAGSTLMASHEDECYREPSMTVHASEEKASETPEASPLGVMEPFPPSRSYGIERFRRANDNRPEDDWAYSPTTGEWYDRRSYQLKPEPKTGKSWRSYFHQRWKGEGSRKWYSSMEQLRAAWVKAIGNLEDFRPGRDGVCGPGTANPRSLDLPKPPKSKAFRHIHWRDPRGILHRYPIGYGPLGGTVKVLKRKATK